MGKNCTINRFVCAPFGPKKNWGKYWRMLEINYKRLFWYFSFLPNDISKTFWVNH